MKAIKVIEKTGGYTGRKYWEVVHPFPEKSGYRVQICRTLNDALESANEFEKELRSTKDPAI